jgi:hypothetical protein
VFEQVTPLGDLTVRWTGGEIVDEATPADLGGAADEEYA